MTIRQKKLWWFYRDYDDDTGDEAGFYIAKSQRAVRKAMALFQQGEDVDYSIVAYLCRDMVVQMLPHNRLIYDCPFQVTMEWDDGR